MLIRFTVENFRSIAEEITFSMLPGRMQKHANHIIKGGDSHNIDVLRTGLLYGANASGKSNLIRAMDFARKLIVDGLKPKQRIPTQPFRLNTQFRQKTSRFEFEFVTAGQAYAYGFVIDNKYVHEEWLYLMDKQQEFALFERVTGSDLTTKVSFPNPQLLADYDDQDEQFLHFIERSTRPNQLFLTKSSEDNLTYFSPVFDWFNNTLAIVFPESTHRNLIALVHEDEDSRDSLSKFLSAMHTGIVKVCLNSIDVDKIPLPADILATVLDELDNETGVIFNAPLGGRFLANLDIQGQQQIYSLGTVHHLSGGEEMAEVTFEVFEESDGTQRLFDLFPILYAPHSKVFVIDELERSLHPNLVRRFMQWFLDSNSTNQLIVSTHESTMLDLELLRRDEIWFVEKSPAGNSALYSLEEFKPRADLDIRKGYLHGRFGAIPVLGSSLPL